MWIEYNPNPTGKKVEDCVVRALTVALDTDWDGAYAAVVAMGHLLNDMPHSNEVWGAVLRNHGYSRMSIPDTCPDCYTAADFANDHNDGTYVLGFGRHTATVRGGCLYDSWDSSAETPQYVWYRKDG